MTTIKIAHLNLVQKVTVDIKTLPETCIVCFPGFLYVWNSFCRFQWDFWVSRYYFACLAFFDLAFHVIQVSLYSTI